MHNLGALAAFNKQKLPDLKQINENISEGVSAGHTERVGSF